MKNRVINRRKSHNLTPWFFLAPPLFIYGVWFAYPVIYSLILSFYESDGVSSTRSFVGFLNYKNSLLDGSVLLALKNNLIYSSLFLTVPTFIGFILALMLYRDTTFNIIIRSVVYLPMMLSYAVASIIWLWVYEPTYGLITQILQLFSITPLTSSLVTNPRTSIIAIAIVGIWQWTGFPLVLYTAALKEIPRDLLDAADIDGATYFQRIIYIVIPLVRNATFVIVSIGFILSVKVFDLVFIMVSGYYKSDVLGTLVWKTAFDMYQFGRAASVSVIQFMISAVVIIPYVWKSYRLKG